MPPSPSQIRKTLEDIFMAGVRAADPQAAVRRSLRVCEGRLHAGERAWGLDDFERIFLVGAGKASAAMAAAAEDILGDRVAGGAVNTSPGAAVPLKRLVAREAGHPAPDCVGMEGAREILGIAQEAGERDLVLCCVSGGGSALLPLPAEGLTLEDLQETTRLLLESGADIGQVNAMRKHLSAVKGGRLARAAWPARVVSLILSDVVGDPIGVIASGPTAPDDSTFADCLGILDRYGLRERVPQAVRRHVEAGAAGRVPDTPKPGDPVFGKVCNLLVATNRQAVAACEAAARERGLGVVTLSTTIQGEAREVAKVHAAILREAVESGRPAAPPCCIVSGGETTVTVRGKGKGGRNQEFALAAAIELEGIERVGILSAGTDGIDGPTDAAGAFADGGTVARGRAMGLGARSFLDDNNAYAFFERLGDLLVTGPTRTNVMDLRLMVALGQPGALPLQSLVRSRMVC